MANRRPSGDGMIRQKKKGQWEGRITVGHKKDGSPIFRYVYGKTQKEALEKMHQRNYDLYERERNKPQQLTLFNVYGFEEDYDYEKVLKECIISCKIRN